MSENLDLVLGLVPPPDTDLAELFRNDALWGAYSARVAWRFHPDCKSTVTLKGRTSTYEGLDGIRKLWRQTLDPWAMFRGEVMDSLGRDDRVLWLVRNTMRRTQEEREITRLAAALWTIRDGKIVRVAFYPDRADAIKAMFAGEER
jgi:ketosteroid isomerase-like protein